MKWSEIKLTETEINNIVELSGEGEAFLQKEANRDSRNMLNKQLALARLAKTDSLDFAAVKRALRKAKKQSA